MEYDIEPTRITGANRYGRTFIEKSGVNLKNIQKGDLEQVLYSTLPMDGFYLTARLQISFEAKVLRNLKPGQEIVRLSSDGRHIDLLRDVEGKPGDIELSCDPNGDEVSVDTLNIKFRDYDDSFTDRGIVWVFPGNPATMGFLVKARALETSGVVTKIVTEAEEALRTKILAHF